MQSVLGQGTFGQVVKCRVDDASSSSIGGSESSSAPGKAPAAFAVKVIKNQPAYYHQALVEVNIVRMVRSVDI